MNKWKIGVAVLLLAVAASPAAAMVDRAIIAMDVDECSIRRGPNEPPAHCGNGSGNGNGGLRYVAEMKPAVERHGVAAASWGQVKAVALAAR